LNWALREVLGDRVDQKGSLVDAEKTRFDFSHSKPVSADELRRIESLVNERIAEGLTVFAASREDDFVDQSVAREITTLRAVFGEKYPDRVRVVSIGAPITEADANEAGADDWLLKSPKSDKWMSFSVEFCGGTHLKNTKDAVDFVLTQEEAVAKGVRRLVGVAGERAKAAREAGSRLTAKAEEVAKLPADRMSAGIGELAEMLSNAVIPVLVGHDIRERIVTLQKQAKAHSKAAANVAAGDVMDAAAKLLESSETVGDVRVIVGEVPSANTDALRGAIDWFRQKAGSTAVLLACQSAGKVTLLAGMSEDVVARGVKAGELIREVAPLVGGKGGGRPDMAQGGGTEAGGIGEAIERAKAVLAEKLG
jgi:alanyl-tRNA synthetase